MASNNRPPKKEKKNFYLNNPNLPTPGATFEYSPEMVREIKICNDDVLHFAEKYFYIVNLDEGRQIIKLHPYQRRVLAKMRDNRFFILLSGRQIGKSTLLTIYALWMMCFNQDQRVVIVANKEATAIEIFKRVRLAYEELPAWLKPGVLEYGKTSMKLANGSEASISTTTGSAVRGLSINLLVTDELAHIDSNMLEDFWRSVYPTITSSKKSKIFVSSTPNGVGNLFHKLWTGAIHNENGFAHDEVRWEEIPGRDEKWKAETIKSLGSYEAWLQEYDAQFLQNGDGSIDYEFFDTLVSKIKPPIHIYEDGHYNVYENPAEDRIYTAGVDTSEGVGKDSSIISIYDITNLQDIRQVALYANNKISPFEFTMKVNEILTQWGRPFAFVERNGVGAQVADSLRFKHGYEKLINWGGKSANRQQQNGIICHTNTKFKGVMNMRYWVNELKAVQFNDLETIKEFREFMRYPNGSWAAKSGFHDDRVMATVWALLALQEEICNNLFEITETDDNNKPKSIVSIELNMGLVINPESIYMDDALFMNEVTTLPCVFGGQDQQAGDIEELKQAGWTKI